MSLEAINPRCKTCCWWNMGTETERGQSLGSCNREGFRSGPIFILAQSTDGDGTYLETTDDFGCILWKERYNG